MRRSLTIAIATLAWAVILGAGCGTTTSNTTASAASTTCAGPIQYGYSAIPDYIWATNWNNNENGCQQQSKVQCAHSGGITKIFYGGFTVPDGRWSGVNCPSSYPAFVQGGYRVRPFNGGPIVRNKWVFHQGRQPGSAWQHRRKYGR